MVGESSSATPCAGEEQRLVEPALVRRLHAQALRVRDDDRVAGLAALVERNGSRADRQRQDGRQPRELDAQPAVGAALAVTLRLGRRPARVHERGLERVEVPTVRGGPVERSRQPGAAVELARVAARGVPVAGGLHQVLVQAESLGVLLQPGPEPRPLAEQRLVRDLHRAVGDGHEPAVGQGRERRRGVRVTVGVELGDGAPAARAGARRCRQGAAAAAWRQVARAR